MEISYVFYAQITRKSCAVEKLNAILRTHLKDVRPIATAHCYCARKLTRDVMHWARALSNKIKNDREDGHCNSFGLNDLGHSVTAPFLSRNRFYLQLSTHYPNMYENWVWEVEKTQDFCPRDIESCDLATARCVKLWSLILNFFKDSESIQLSRNLLNRST